MLQKGIFSYELVNDCEKFIETSLPKKEDSCSHLNTEDITDASYMCTKQDFERKKKGNILICIFEAIYYCYLMYLRTLEKCLKIYELVPA